MRFLPILAALAVGATLLTVTAEAGAHGWTKTTVVAHSTSCPIAGQCAVDPKTGCPLGGPAGGPHPASPAPITVTPPDKCVLVPSTLFYASGRNASGCTEVLFVQLKLQPGITQYESVVYSLVGEGTRWWADPRTGQDQTGPATQPGHTFKTGVMSYTVPSGLLAWDVAGGSGGPTGCTDTVPPPGLTEGFAAWGVKTSGGASAGALIHVQGPTHIVFHRSFTQVVSGTSGVADYVVSGEQLGWARCAPTLTAEAARSGWTQWPSATGSVHGSFHLVARFYARNRLRHAICSYLINSSTKQTYAHAANYWSNS